MATACAAATCASSDTAQNTVTLAAPGCEPTHRSRSPLDLCSSRVVKITTGVRGSTGNPATSTGGVASATVPATRSKLSTFTAPRLRMKPAPAQ